MLGRLWTVFALRRNARLVWRLARDPRVSFTAKLPLPVALLYVLSPVDVAPDLLPLIGQMDDVTILVVATLLLLRLAPSEVVREHVEALAGRRPPTRGSSKAGEVIEGDYEVLE